MSLTIFSIQFQPRIPFLKMLLLLMVIITMINTMHAQDQFASSWNYAQLITTPCSFTKTNGNRIFVQYRSQWNQSTTGYKGYAIGFDRRSNQWNYGITLNGMMPSSETMKWTDAFAKIGYTRKLTSQLSLNVGFKGGARTFRYNETKMEFGSQYNSTFGYQSDIPSGEVIPTGNVIQPSLGSGIGVDIKVRKFSSASSLTIDHLVGNNNAENSVKLDRLLSVYNKTSFTLSEKTTASIIGIYRVQASFQTIDLGLEVTYQVNTATNVGMSVQKRNKRNYVAGLMIEHRSFQVEGHYTFGGLSSTFEFPMKNTFELGISYYFGRKTKGITNKIKRYYPDDDEKDYYEEDFIGSTDSTIDFIVNSPSNSNIETDRDKDGIIDKLDSCPNLKGVEENNGCPFSAKDFDGDGVLNSKDECPYEKGSHEQKGCPDSDRDKIIDKRDKTPYLSDNIAPKN